MNDSIVRLGLTSGASTVTVATAFAGHLLKTHVTGLGAAAARDRVQALAQEAYAKVLDKVSLLRRDLLRVLGPRAARRAHYASTGGANAPFLTAAL